MNKTNTYIQELAQRYLGNPTITSTYFNVPHTLHMRHMNNIANDNKNPLQPVSTRRELRIMLISAFAFVSCYFFAKKINILTKETNVNECNEKTTT